MKIHISAKFSTSYLRFHDEFDLEASEIQLLENKEKVATFAISSIKKKCEEYFESEFGTMVFFEVYFFVNGIEKLIFKKEKTV